MRATYYDTTCTLYRQPNRLLRPLIASVNDSFGFYAFRIILCLMPWPSSYVVVAYLKQCAAVSTYWSVTIDPPQKNFLLAFHSDAIHGNSLSPASLPPTTLEPALPTPHAVRKIQFILYNNRLPWCKQRLFRYDDRTRF